MASNITSSENVQMIEQYLTEKYEFRFNVLSNKIEVRELKREVTVEEQDASETTESSADKGTATEFVPLTEKKRNSIIRGIKLDLDEVTSVKQNVQEYIDSEDIPQYDPIADWLRGLPKWDGRNRVAELFGRIPGISTEQIYWCTIWMRSTVAHWLTLDMLHGNESVPVLIGAQGCGKSTFCHRLLPPFLRTYYLDHINFANKNDKEMALTNNLLINIDELDQISSSRQPELKQTLSKVKVNGRPIFGRAQQDRKRYASFVATTNNPHPLNDPTGSRRYLCIRIPDGMLIDNTSEIEYEQLYAQIMEEVTVNGCRYWFTPEETQFIQRENAQFQQEQDLTTMLEFCFRKAKDGEVGRYMTVKEIISVIEKQFPLIKKSHSFTIHVGLHLKEMGFVQKVRNGRSCYNVVVQTS